MTRSHLSLFDLAPEKVLVDRYRIVAPHRENGMSAAFRVQDLEEDAERELQAFPGSLFEGEPQAKAFADTMGRWQALEHPAVVRARSVDVLGDGAVLAVSDFPSGQALRDVTKDNAVRPAEEVVALGAALLEGLEVSHAAGLIHGDIKPSTIFVADEGPSLVDGGITPGLWEAKHLGTRTALIGTPFYAPLEQFGGDSPDESSDLYNVATVLYELLTGVMPWKGKSFIEVFQSKMQPEAPAMRTLAPSLEVDRDLEAAIGQALRGKRTERHASAAEFREALTSARLA